MKTTPAMRARIRELAHAPHGNDDYDRAVIAICDDFDTLHDALKTIADPENHANWRTQIFAKAIIDPELQPL